MEVKGRHNRSGLLSTRCGINFPWIEYKHLVQGELPSVSKYQTGVYWVDEFKDIIHSAKYQKKERYSLTQHVQPYQKPHIFAVFDMKDPKPFLKRGFDIIKMVFQEMLLFASKLFSSKLHDKDTKS